MKRFEVIKFNNEDDLLHWQRDYDLDAVFGAVLKVRQIDKLINELLDLRKIFEDRDVFKEGVK